MCRPTPTTYFEFRVIPLDANTVQVEWFDPKDSARICTLITPITADAHKAAIKILTSARTGLYWPTENSVTRCWPDEAQEPKEIADWRAAYAVSGMPAAEVIQH